RRRHTRFSRDWSSDVCSSDLGIFLDNTFRSFFDFGHERKNAYSFWAHGGEMNYYFIYGPQLIKVCETFVHMTGRPELPPMWALEIGRASCRERVWIRVQEDAV